MAWWGSGVRIPSAPSVKKPSETNSGGFFVLAEMVEHPMASWGCRGSNPLSSIRQETLGLQLEGFCIRADARIVRLLPRSRAPHLVHLQHAKLAQSGSFPAGEERDDDPVRESIKVPGPDAASIPRRRLGPGRRPWRCEGKRASTTRFRHRLRRVSRARPFPSGP